MKPLALNECCVCLNLLASDAAESKRNASHASHMCKLGTQHIAANASIVENPGFKGSVVKTQNNDVDSLTDILKEAVERLRKQHNVIPNEPGTPTEETQLWEDQIDKHQCPPHVQTGDQCINCDFVLGSMAEVEHLWSMCDKVLTNECSLLHP